ncbi:nose resistant to fluoxetine protein 6-like [Anthonomus grandis grandis]|uniref:nose resistant to fluoxetine protein 6-like n=1 Tax=Anthonomus grandis grandis TaxID=2921223 RepID=UPI0021650AD2|nr:nose resistant to fluoxetine protein 6-like [Anthonomus grandis grandis]
MAIIFKLSILLPVVYSVFGLNENAAFKNEIKTLKRVSEEAFGNLSLKENLLESFNNLYLDFVCSQDFSNRNVSNECFKEMEVVCNTTDLLFDMADAWSKIPYSGMRTATKQDFGAFDQCIKIDYQNENMRILGKHCTFGWAIPMEDSVYLLSYCMPNSCSATDLIRMINTISIPENILEQVINDRTCTNKLTNSEMDPSSIVVTTLFATFLFLVVLSTVYEVYQYKKNVEKSNPLLTIFSIFSNGKKLIQTSKNISGEQIQVFHGIKVISMMWILAGHAAGFFAFLPVTNQNEMDSFQTEKYARYITAAHLAVDTFFYISGFLLAYQYFKTSSQKPILVQLISVPSMILHRYLRITPVVLMFFLYAVYLAKYIGDGPIFTIFYDTLNTPCKEHWWAVFLYIQNYYNPNDMCYVHLWYLSADFQLFFIGLFIMIGMAWQYKRRFNMVLMCMIFLNVLFLALPLYTKLRFPNYDPEHLEYETHSKLITYFMGVMFGFYFRCQRHKPFIFNRVSNIVVWIITLSAMFTCTVVLHEVYSNDSSHIGKSLCDVFIKPFWCLGLTFITYSSIYGHGGIINWFLSTAFMQVISKLTFCVYILHMPVIVFWIATRRTRHHFSDLNLFFYYWGYLVITIMVSVIWTLMFESPIINMEKLIFGSGKPKKPAPKNKDEKPTEHNGKHLITVTHKAPEENGYC